MPRKNNALLNIILDFCFLCAIIFCLSTTDRISSVGRVENVSIYDISLRRDVGICIPWQNTFLNATLQQNLSSVINLIYCNEPILFSQFYLMFSQLSKKKPFFITSRFFYLAPKIRILISKPWIAMKDTHYWSFEINRRHQKFRNTFKGF